MKSNSAPGRGGEGTETKKIIKKPPTPTNQTNQPANQKNPTPKQTQARKASEQPTTQKCFSPPPPPAGASRSAASHSFPSLPPAARAAAGREMLTRRSPGAGRTPPARGPAPPLPPRRSRRTVRCGARPGPAVAPLWGPAAPGGSLPGLAPRERPVRRRGRASRPDGRWGAPGPLLAASERRGFSSFARLFPRRTGG